MDFSSKLTGLTNGVATLTYIGTLSQMVNLGGGGALLYFFLKIKVLLKFARINF
jgi:hypothetical protein